MSSKKNTSASASDAPSTLVPKLRFPEFEGAWDVKHLGDQGEFLASLFGKTGRDFDVGEAKFITYMNVFANTFVDPMALKSVDVKVGENQNAVAVGDVFFTISSETPEEVGMSSVLLEGIENCYLNSFCALFRFSDSKRPNPVFTGYMLRQPIVRDYFAKKAQGSTRFNLSKDAFRSLPVLIPSLEEQQRIASCLSSLDELITAQTQKVEVLKTHKKGLMQQLFPREGETQPRLRFPEFEGEWEEVILGDLSEVVRGGSPRPIDAFLTTAADGLNWLKIGDVDKEAKFVAHTAEKVRPEALSKTRVVRPGDLILSNSMSFGRPYILQINTCIHDGWIAITDVAKKANTDFIYYSISTPSSQSYFVNNAAGSGVQNLNAEIIKALPVCIPSLPEQQRIASCLSSLDELITNESNKLDVYKTHKKGLMQGLFPSIQEN